MAWLRFSADGRRVVINLDHVQSATYNPESGAELRLYPSVVRTAEDTPAEPWVLRGTAAQEAAKVLDLDTSLPDGGARIVKPGGGGGVGPG